jgi:hypothetical protein
VTRVLYWNIENFARNKIANPSNARQKGAAVTNAVASTNRAWYIQQVLQAVAPHVIVVVEVETGWDGPPSGQLARGTGLSGTLTLLNSIRAWLGATWMLVPPLQTGPREAVAVYYNSTRRYFTGPFVWPGGAGPPVDPIPGPVPPLADYPNAPDNVRGGLPDPAVGGRGNVPANAQYNVGRPERHCAARTIFTHSANNMLQAGDPVAWGPKARAPYMVTFAETDGAGAVTRNLTVFGVHAPAKQAPAVAHMRLIADTAQVIDNLGATETRMVVGDFNVNLMRAPAHATPYAVYPAYNLLTAEGYVRGLDPLPAPPAPVNGYPDYLATHIRPRRTAACWGPGGPFYPGYRYTGSDFVDNFYAIDNVFVHPNNGVGVPTNITILNPLVGTPFNTHAAPFPVPGPGGSGTRLVGSIALPRLGGVPPQPPAAVVPPVIAGPGPAQGPVNQPGIPGAFRGWANYGFIRSTSDHFALAFDL